MIDRQSHGEERPSTMNPYKTRELSVHEASLALAEAGIHARVVSVRPCAGGVANWNHEVVLQGGRRVLLRRYDVSQMTSRQTELALGPILAGAGIASPRVVAVPPDPSDFAVFEWIDGLRLRDPALDASSSEMGPAWLAAGRELRRTHDLPVEDVRELRDGAVPRSSARDWASAYRDEMTAAGFALLREGWISVPQHERIQAAAARAEQLVGAYRPSLLHGDAHAANVLVRKGHSSWELAAWIDWERACIGDPESDLATFDVFTRAQVGGTPEVFWVGYGRRPEESIFRFYELHLVLFLASLETAQALPPGREARKLVVEGLDGLLERIGV